LPLPHLPDAVARLPIGCAPRRRVVRFRSLPLARLSLTDRLRPEEGPRVARSARGGGAPRDLKRRSIPARRAMIRRGDFVPAASPLTRSLAGTPSPRSVRVARFARTDRLRPEKGRGSRALLAGVGPREIQEDVRSLPRYSANIPTVTRSHWRWLVVAVIFPAVASKYGLAALYVLFGAMISASVVVACRKT